MKKLYISFVLLFGFLAFVPQVALGDVALTPQERREVEKRNNERLECISAKKSEILKHKYVGPSIIKPQKGSISYKGYFSSGNNNWQDSFSFLNTGLLYMINLESYTPYPGPHFMFTIGNPYSAYVAQSVVDNNCREYVVMVESNAKRSYPSYIYDVTQVPPYSYLKYNPETQEILVLPPTKELYEEIIINLQEQLKKMDEEIEGIKKANMLDNDLKVQRVNTIERLEQKIEYLIEQMEEQRFQMEQISDNSIPDFVIRGMLIALLLTLVIEGLIAAPFGWKFVGIVSLANIITNPALNGIIWHYQITDTATILWLETAVVLIEWGIFSSFIRKNYGKLLLFAFVANLVSYLSGVFFPL